MNFTVLCKIKANDIISTSETPGSEILKVTVDTFFLFFLERKQTSEKIRSLMLLQVTEKAIINERD